MALFEVRTYPVNDAAMQEWTAFVPLIEDQGMKVSVVVGATEGSPLK